jgi:PAS domain S-box-containing protein
MIDTDQTGVRIRGYVLQASGYTVMTTTEPEEARVLLQQSPDAVVCNLHVKDDSGTPLIEELRRLVPAIPFVAMIDTPYSNTPDDVADRFVMKLDGPRALLSALDEVLRFQHHRHTEFEGDCVVFVDRERRYVDATEQACELIGYRRQELIGLKIDDVSIQDAQDVQGQFAKYLAEGEQSGVFWLRHRDGHPVAIHYRSLVLPDGCMAAEWQPAQPAPQQSGT